MEKKDNALLTGDGGNADQLSPALARIENGEGVLAYEEENTLITGDGGCDAQLFLALSGIVNGGRNSLSSKSKKRIPPKKKKKKFGRLKTGKNKETPFHK